MIWDGSQGGKETSGKSASRRGGEPSGMFLAVTLPLGGGHRERGFPYLIIYIVLVHASGLFGQELGNIVNKKHIFGVILQTSLCKFNFLL